MRFLLSGLLSALLFPFTAQAQFQFFEQMFQGNQQQQQQQQPQNVASDSSWYRQNYEAGELPLKFSTLQQCLNVANNSVFEARCSNYLCPGTLSCVHFPHHCPCPFPNTEDKIELGEGIAVCVSKGGFKAGEAARKIELARKGLL